MAKEDKVYCRVETARFEDNNIVMLKEELHDFEQVWSCLINIWDTHKQKNPDVGVCSQLFNNYGGQLEVGISSHGWLLALRHPDSVQEVFSLAEPNGYVAFLTPEWSEFPHSCLHDEINARNAIMRWLDTGAMCLFLVPGRDLGYPFGTS